MIDRTIRSALDAAALHFCERPTPCFSCRMVARDLILTFLGAVPEPLVAIPSLELRLKLQIEGSDG